MMHKLTQEQKDRVDKICSRIAVNGSPRKFYFNDRVNIKLSKEFDYRDKLSKVRYGNGRDRGTAIIFKIYLKHLIAESLKNKIDIFIPHIGKLRVREIESVGKKKKVYDENRRYRYRLDTVFDKKVMYRIYPASFLRNKLGSLMNIEFSIPLMKEILFSVYKQDLPIGTYPFKTKKNDK